MGMAMVGADARRVVFAGVWALELGMVMVVGDDSESHTHKHE